jgi:hypothetical protein
VGAQLYEIDTEAEASVAHAELVEASGFPPSHHPLESGGGDDTGDATPATQPPAVLVAATEDAAPHHRVPSIHFLQKEGWAMRKSGQPVEAASAASGAAPTPVPAIPASAQPPASPRAVVTLAVDAVPPMYGRPQFTPAEMDALMYGGANLLDAAQPTGRSRTEKVVDA